MTIGQRIAALRKERHFSQEELGAQLGVSRQSIYKWESDASIPEIDKLIALSKLFGVSIGWLLGVEEERAAEPDTQPEELTEAQLKMVEEIAGRYAQALPRQHRLPYIVGIVSAVVVAVVTTTVACGALLHLNTKLDTQYGDLENKISGIESSVDGKIDRMVDRVEETLDEKNNLLSSYGTSFVSCDPGANTATFSLQAVPKTYVEGMTATFCAVTGDGAAEVSGVLAAGQCFAAELTCPLSDEITLSVIFDDGEKREAQQLGQYTGLYTETLPVLETIDFVNVQDTYPKQKDAKVLKDCYILVAADEKIRDSAHFTNHENNMPAKIASIKIGVFQNQRLLAWAEPCALPKGYRDFSDYSDYNFYRVPDKTLSWAENDKLQSAAVITDEYGRTLFYLISRQWWNQMDSCWHVEGNRYLSSAEGWTF